MRKSSTEQERKFVNPKAFHYICDSGLWCAIFANKLANPKDTFALRPWYELPICWINLKFETLERAWILTNQQLEENRRSSALILQIHTDKVEGWKNMIHEGDEVGLPVKIPRDAQKSWKLESINGYSPSSSFSCPISRFLSLQWGVGKKVTDLQLYVRCKNRDSTAKKPQFCPMCTH